MKKEKYPQWWLKAKTISEIYPDGSYEKVSNYIKIIDKEYVV